QNQPTTLPHGALFTTCTIHHSTCPSFFEDSATTEIYTLSLHDALPGTASGPRVFPAQNTRPLKRCASAERRSHTKRFRPASTLSESAGSLGRLDNRRTTESRASRNSRVASSSGFCFK